MLATTSDFGGARRNRTDDLFNAIEACKPDKIGHLATKPAPFHRGKEGIETQCSPLSMSNLDRPRHPIYVTPTVPWGRDMGKALTVRTLETLKPGPTRKEVPDGLVRGLYFVIQSSGMQSWACRYRLGGRTRKFTIGSYPAIDLKAARDLAKNALVKVAQGMDPYEDKKAAKAPPDLDLIEKVVETFVSRHAKLNTRPTTAGETERSLKKEVVERWKGRRLSTITRAEVHELLDSIIDRGSPVMANRLLATLSKLCSWSVERGLIAVSPCAGVKPPTAHTSRDRVLSDPELKRIWRACDALAYPFGPLVRMLVLTGQRRNEVAGLPRAELDMIAKLWVLPRERAKNNTEHTIPLSPMVVDLIGMLPHIGEGEGLLFTTNGRTPVSGFSKAKITLDILLKADGGEPIPHWTFHDLRRTTATGMARLGINLPVVEKVLNHTSGSFRGVAGVYNRHSFDAERRHALDAWGAFVERLVTAEPGANVVALMSRAS